MLSGGEGGQGSATRGSLKIKLQRVLLLDMNYSIARIIVFRQDGVPGVAEHVLFPTEKRGA